MVFSDFGHDDPFRRYSRSKSEVVENRPKFCMFLAPHFLGWGNAPEFSDLIYLFPQVSDHVAKFHGDRSRDGGEKLAKEIKKKHHEQNRRPPVLPNGRPNKQVSFKNAAAGSDTLGFWPVCLSVRLPQRTGHASFLTSIFHKVV